MTEYRRKQAEEAKRHGIDTLLDALYLYCESGNNCTDCQYINESDGCCQVLEYIVRNGQFPKSEDVPCGDRGYSDDHDY